MSKVKSKIIEDTSSEYVGNIISNDITDATQSGFENSKSWNNFVEKKPVMHLKEKEIQFVDTLVKKRSNQLWIVAQALKKQLIVQKCTIKMGKCFWEITSCIEKGGLNMFEKEFQLYRITSKDDKYIIVDFKVIQDLNSSKWYLVDTSRPLISWIFPIFGKIKLRAFPVAKNLLESQFNIHDHTLTPEETQKLADSGGRYFGPAYAMSAIILALIYLMAGNSYILEFFTNKHEYLKTLIFIAAGLFLNVAANYFRRITVKSKLKNMDTYKHNVFLSDSIEFKHKWMNIITMTFTALYIAEGLLATNSQKYSQSDWCLSVIITVVLQGLAIVSYVNGQTRWAPKNANAEKSMNH